MNTANISQMVVITLMGLLIVFSVLIVLWAVIEIMHAIVSRMENKDTSIPETRENPTVSAPLPVADPAPAALDDEADGDDEIAAVIAAAIAAYTSGEGSTSTYNLRIKSFKRISKSKSVWNSDSRGGYEII